MLLAFIALAVGAGFLSLAPLSDDSLSAILQPITGGLILLFALLLWRNLPPHERRLTVALKHSRGGAIGLGLVVGIGCVIGAGTLLAIGRAIDPVVRRRLDDLSDELQIGTAHWQIALMGVALIVLAPFGEELLFRGMLLRGLARRLRFWPSALISGAVFASSHFDAYVLWPRALGLALTGVALAWLYRWRGYWASVAAHATVNVVAFIALVASS